MDDKQQEFQAWLADKLQAKDQADLLNKAKQMGEEGIRKAYDQFLQEKQEVQSNREGGKLDYIIALQAFKKGGMVMKKCSTGDKMEDGGMLSKKIDKRKDVDTKEKNPGKKDWMSANKKKVQTAVGGVKEHQAGGSITTRPAITDPKQDWNRFINWMGAKGYAGNQQMNHNQQLGRQYLDEYKRQHADSKLTYDQIASMQQSVQNQRNSDIDQVASGQAKLQGNGWMEGASKVDGWLGTKTATMPFPTTTMIGGGNASGGTAIAPQTGISDKAKGMDNHYDRWSSDAHADIPMIKSAQYRATGGIVNKIKYGSISDSDKKQWTPQGERNDGGKKEHTAVGKNGGIGKKLVAKGNGTRKDVDNKEKNPGKKDWMDKGDTKQWNSAVTKVPKGQQGTKLSGGQPQQGKQLLPKGA